MIRNVGESSWMLPAVEAEAGETASCTKLFLALEEETRVPIWAAPHPLLHPSPEPCRPSEVESLRVETGSHRARPRPQSQTKLPKGRPPPLRRRRTAQTLQSCFSSYLAIRATLGLSHLRPSRTSLETMCARSCLTRSSWSAVTRAPCPFLTGANKEMREGGEGIGFKNGRQGSHVDECRSMRRTSRLFFSEA
jgi:hypothetical protein